MDLFGSINIFFYLIYKLKLIMKIILIMGLPGAGKTTLADELAPMLNAKRLNADEVRKAANDWDFSPEGRTRQAKRMADFATKLKEEGNFVIADFIFIFLLFLCKCR